MRASLFFFDLTRSRTSPEEVGLGESRELFRDQRASDRGLDGLPVEREEGEDVLNDLEST